MPTDSLTMRVTHYVFDYIQKNQLTSGESLPSELQTSSELGVSRGIVREAFRSLQLAGIIEKANGRSPKVGVLDSYFLARLMQHALLTQQVSVMQVLELRTSIEVTAAELAAQRRKRSDVQRLRAAVEGMRRSVQKTNAFVDHDLAFHQVINGATGNSLIEVICSAMHESMRESMRIGLTKRRGNGEITEVAELHGQIADAIERGSVSQAGKFMKKHFDDTQRAFAKFQIK